jgi:hypothetical protein
MSYELHYTSVAKGLKPGSRGFCTVACTAGLPGPLAERLESLSGYRPVYPDHAPEAARNPVAFSHVHLAVGGQAYGVLSRVAPSGRDYTDRANKYAHHVALDPRERPAGGPAWLLSQPGFLRTAWEGEPRLLPAPAPPPNGDRPPGIAHAWKALTGDAGWAGALADAFLADPRRPAYLLFAPGQDLLPLFAEAFALLPPARRWDVTFSTYAASVPQGVPCLWKALVRDTPEAQAALRQPGALVIDLTAPLPAAPAGPLVTAAREGPRVTEAGASSNAWPALGPTPAETTPSHLAALPAAVSESESLYTVIPEIEPSPTSRARRPRREASPRRGPRWLLVLMPVLLLLVSGVAGGVAWWLYGRSTPAARSDLPRPPAPAAEAAHRAVQQLENKLSEVQRRLADELSFKKAADLQHKAEVKLLTEASEKRTREADQLLAQAKREAEGLRLALDAERERASKIEADLEVASQPPAVRVRKATSVPQVREIGPLPPPPMLSSLRDELSAPSRMDIGRAVRHLKLLTLGPAGPKWAGGEPGPKLVCRDDAASPEPGKPASWTVSYLDGQEREHALISIRSDGQKNLIIEYTEEARRRATAERGGLPKLASEAMARAVLEVVDERNDPEYLQFRRPVPEPIARPLRERAQLSNDGRFELGLDPGTKSYPMLRLANVRLDAPAGNRNAVASPDGDGFVIDLGSGQLLVSLGRSSNGAALLRGTFSPALDRTLTEIDQGLSRLMGPIPSLEQLENRADKEFSLMFTRYRIALGQLPWSTLPPATVEAKLRDSTVSLMDYYTQARGSFREGRLYFDLVAPYLDETGQLIELTVSKPEGAQ